MIPGAGTLSRYDPLLSQQINNKPTAGHSHLCVHCIRSQVNCTTDATVGADGVYDEHITAYRVEAQFAEPEPTQRPNSN